jgi:hypothetical protein
MNVLSFFHFSSSDNDMTNLEHHSRSYLQKGAKLRPLSLQAAKKKHSQFKVFNLVD